MNVYLTPTGRRIQPFGDPVGDMPVNNRPLHTWQHEAFAAAKLTVVDHPDPPCLIVPDNLFTSGAALRRFVDGAGGRNAVLTLAKSRFGEVTTHVQPNATQTDAGWRFPTIHFDSGGDEPARDVVLDPDEKVIPVPIPQAFTGRASFDVGIPRYPVLLLDHWVHILFVNQHAAWIELLNTPRWKLAARALWAAIRARSFNKWRVLSKMNRIGKGCDIHPTALVEGATIGDNVRIGAYAHVQMSILGSGVTVMPAAQVNLSVVGDESVISEQCVLRCSVLFPRAIVAQRLMQQCVLGREAVTTAGGGTIDFNFEGDVKVPLDGKLHSTGSPFMGSAFGHRARVGTGFYLACGRSIPNGYFLIRDPRQVLSQIPSGLEGNTVVASTHRATPLQLFGRSRRHAQRAPRIEKSAHE